jgi:hypothetical protein
LFTVPEPSAADSHGHNPQAVTLLRFHRGFKDFEYRFLYSSCTWRIAIQAAIGSSNNPWQWLCQR